MARRPWLEPLAGVYANGGAATTNESLAGIYASDGAATTNEPLAGVYASDDARIPTNRWRTFVSAMVPHSPVSDLPAYLLTVVLIAG